MKGSWGFVGSQSCLVCHQLFWLFLYASSLIHFTFVIVRFQNVSVSCLWPLSPPINISCLRLSVPLKALCFLPSLCILWWVGGKFIGDVWSLQGKGWGVGVASQYVYQTRKFWSTYSVFLLNFHMSQPEPTPAVEGNAAEGDEAFLTFQRMCH